MTTATQPGITITLPPLHPTQQAIARSDARFKVVCCGRRYGKTMLGIVMCLRSALKGGRVWWVAPSYKQALEGWSYLQRLIVQMPKSIATTQISDLTVKFTGGGSVQVRTGDNPDNLRGAGLDGVVLDEAATMKPDVWDLVLRPALADREGWALFISTPQHFNWFYELWERGQDSANHDWASWQHPTWDNPFIAQSEIDAAQRDMLQEDFDQEFGASFTAVGGAVWRLLSTNRPFYLREMPEHLTFRRTGVGMDWGTTLQHKAATVSGGILTSGAVWHHSSWEDYSGSSDLWRAEAVRCKRDYGATFARVDRSQSSELDRLKAEGFWDVDKGNPHVDVRISELSSLIISKNVFWNIKGRGMVEHYERLCAYHRDRDGKIVEEQDDSVDADCYLVSELVRPTAAYDPPTARPVYKSDPRPVPYRSGQQRQQVRGGAA